MWYRIIPALLLAVSLAAQTGQGTAKSAFDRGSAAYQEKRYDEATAAFETAVRLDPGNVTYHMRLGEMYSFSWAAVNFTAENLRLRARAEAEFRIALGIDPNNKRAVAALSRMKYAQAKELVADGPNKTERDNYFAEAESFARRLIQIDPRDVNSLVLFSTHASWRVGPELMRARERLKMSAGEAGPLNSTLRADLLARYGALIDEGIEDLNKALVINPDLPDALEFLSRLYRSRADLADSVDGYQRDTAMAEAFEVRAAAGKKPTD